MIKHYVLSVNPDAEYEWDRYSLRDPIAGQRPELAELIASEESLVAGAYLVSVNVEVKVLEKAPIPQLGLTKQELSLPVEPSEGSVKRVEKLAV